MRTMGKHGRHRASILLGVATMALALVGGASVASAATLLSTGPDIPVPNGPVTVGQSYPSSLTIINNSTESQGALTVTISNITLVPSCGVLASLDCPIAGYDPDVFALSATGTGRAGTACAGRVFNINNIDGLQDKYAFVPQTAAAVVLGPSDTGGLAARCTIDFAAFVLKMPTKDARVEAGVQTSELAGADAVAADAQPGQGTGSNNTTVNRASFPITTQVNPGSITIGGSFSDNATLLPPAGSVPPTGCLLYTSPSPRD